MKKMTKIEPKKAPARKKRVAAYCRVSTGSDAQEESLTAQREHYEQVIKSNPDWEYAGLYYDDGISGTKKDTRPQLLRLLDDCRAGLIDMILTKSISRFARSTIDCLKMTRELISIGVTVYFEREQLDTSSMEDELMLTLLGSMAESESVSISENSKWSTKRRFENDTFKLAYTAYGYDLEDGRPVINTEEAPIVQRIFQMAMNGMGTHKIAQVLNAEEIKPRRGKRWQAGTIKSLLENEIYTGDMLYQKTYTDSNFVRHTNRGECDMYLHEDHHEAIIDRATFDRVQELMTLRGKSRGVEPGDSKYQNRYAFSHKIICGECGRYWKRKQIRGRREGMFISWACQGHIEDKNSCSLISMEESAIQAAFTTMVNKLIYGRRTILAPYATSLLMNSSEEMAQQMQDLDAALEENNRRMQEILNLTAQGVLDVGTSRKAQNELDAKRLELNSEKAIQSIKVRQEFTEAAEAENLVKEISRLTIQKVFDEELFERIVDQIVITSKTELTFCLKCGLELKEVISR